MNLQHRSVLLILIPVATFDVAQDNDAGLGAVWCHVLAALGGHHAHGWDCFGHWLRKTTEAAAFLETNLNVGVVLHEAVFSPHSRNHTT